MIRIVTVKWPSFFSRIFIASVTGPGPCEEFQPLAMKQFSLDFLNFRSNMVTNRRIPFGCEARGQSHNVSCMAHGLPAS